MAPPRRTTAASRSIASSPRSAAANGSCSTRSICAATCGLRSASCADYAYKPLVFYDKDGNEVHALIQNQLFLHVGASMVLWERLRLGVNLPIAAVVDGNGGTLTTARCSTPTNGANIGDLRLSADVRLFGEYGDVITRRDRRLRVRADRQPRRVHGRRQGPHRAAFADRRRPRPVRVRRARRLQLSRRRTATTPARRSAARSCGR